MVCLDTRRVGVALFSVCFGCLGSSSLFPLIDHKWYAHHPCSILIVMFQF